MRMHVLYDHHTPRKLLKHSVNVSGELVGNLSSPHEYLKKVIIEPSTNVELEEHQSFRQLPAPRFQNRQERQSSEFFRRASYSRQCSLSTPISLVAEETAVPDTHKRTTTFRDRQDEESTL